MFVVEVRWGVVGGVNKAQLAGVIREQIVFCPREVQAKLFVVEGLWGGVSMIVVRSRLDVRGRGGVLKVGVLGVVWDISLDGCGGALPSRKGN